MNSVVKIISLTERMFTMKKTLKIALTAVLLSALSAKESSFNKFYVGLGAGSTWQRAHAKEKVTGESFSKTMPKLTGNVFTGYGQTVGDTFYIGGEFMLGLSGKISKKGREKDDEEHIRYHASSGVSYGASLRLGAVCCNTILPYVRLGYEGNSSPIKNQVLNDKNEWKTLFKVSRSGFVTGVGLDWNFHKNVFGRLEYGHNFGSSKTKKINNVSVKAKTKSDTVTVGLGYMF